MPIELTPRQKQVLDSIDSFLRSDNHVFILHGYAGTGKTTLIKFIVDRASKVIEPKLMAPTGRAARVLSQKTGHFASTIHKGIYGSAYLEDNNPEDIADSRIRLVFPIKKESSRVLAIVDESSMVQARTIEPMMFSFGTNNLLADLLTYVQPENGGKIIFVGDPAQLPPVGETVSQALSVDYFKSLGYKVVKEELRDVIRQRGDSAILANAFKIRDLLESDKRNQLVFDEKKGQVERIPDGKLLDSYMDERLRSGKANCVMIAFSNRSASAYNREIRSRLYGQENPPLQVGDILMVVQNNYLLERMNGEFLPVLGIGKTETQSAPVYVHEGGKKERKTITMEFINVRVLAGNGSPCNFLLLKDLLENDEPGLGIDEHTALFINFCMRNSHLKRKSEEFKNALLIDPYYNCLRAKYGYAVTGHKCQGGEWGKVYVDYSGRTGLSDDCLRWSYTATTRAVNALYFSNLPKITPFRSFRMDVISPCSKISEECYVLEKVEESPFQDESTPNHIRAKRLCIQRNFEGTPYKIKSVKSLSYMERIIISGVASDYVFDLGYNGGGIFRKAVTNSNSPEARDILKLLDDERNLPIIPPSPPEGEVERRVFDTIQSCCDTLGIQMTNCANHPEAYKMVFYFRTSGVFSYISVIYDAKGFVTYAKPQSLKGKEDNELTDLVVEIGRRFV